MASRLLTRKPYVRPNVLWRVVHLFCSYLSLLGLGKGLYCTYLAADHVTRMEKTLDVPELITIHQHLQRCWIRTPDSITSDRIWSRYQNERLLNQRNSPPGKYDPRSHLQRTLADITIRRSRQIDDKNWLRELLQADYNAAASWLQRQCKPITTP